MENVQISTDDQNQVQATWKDLYSEWDNGRGVKFYERLHAAYPDIKAYFDKLGPRSDEDKQKQAVRAGKMFHSWIENLGNKEALSEKIAGMVASHKARGVLAILLYEEFFDEMIGYVRDTIGLDSSQLAAWKNVTALFLQLIKSDLP